jgi:hypothetical protein
MIAFILKFFKDRKQAENQRNYQTGYDWAAGKLLRDKTPADVQSWIDISVDMDSYTMFDKGAEQAIIDFENILN